MLLHQYFYRGTISRRIVSQGQRASLSPLDETIPCWTSTQYFLVSGEIIIVIVIIIIIIYIIIIIIYIIIIIITIIINIFMMMIVIIIIVSINNFI